MWEKEQMLFNSGYRFIYDNSKEGKKGGKITRLK